jgi:hypothetical protein
MRALFIIASVSLAALFVDGEPVDDYFANRPDYVLKEGSVGSPRVDVPWLRVTTKENREQTDVEKLCEIRAVVLRSFDAINRSSHTEYIAEVELARSDRPILRDQVVVLHDDRWHDLLSFNDANPFVGGSRWRVIVYGKVDDETKCRFVVEKEEAQPGATDNPGNAQ